MDASEPLDARPGLDAEGLSVSPPSGVAPTLEAAAPTRSVAYSLEALERDARKRLVQVDRLPPWPMPEGEPPPAYGHGWGEALDHLLGRGLRPGELLGIGAASAGAGKTAFLAQVLDGLALRSALVARGESGWGSTLTPVLLASEMPADALSWRSLARWTGGSSAVFRAGQSWRGREGEETWAAARQAFAPASLWSEAGSWLRLLDATHAGLAASEGPEQLVAVLVEVVGRWREQIERQHPGRQVVPVVALDPLHRYLPSDEVADMNRLSRALCAATVQGQWVTLITADTNKVAAKGERVAGATDIEEGSAAFRGSYGLQHEASVLLYLRKPRGWQQDEDEERDGLRHVEAVVVKQRWAGAAPPWPRFRWYGATGRFYPMSREQAERLAHEEAAAKAESRAPRVESNGSTPTPPPYGSPVRGLHLEDVDV